MDWREALREMVRDLWMYYEYNPGKLDRERGWILSWLSGQYRWLARAKLIDLPPRDPESPPPFGGTAPESLDEVVDLWQKQLSALRAGYPRLPLGIVWRSPLFDPSGYADEGRAFVKGLASGERPLRVEEIRWSEKTSELEFGDGLLLKALTRAARPPHAAAITDCIPTLVEPDPSCALNILRTTFETDRLPAGWLEHLARFDEIWVLSQHNYRAFRRSGVAPERLRVVPSCYDPGLYRPQGPRLVLPSELDGRFVFLSVFDWQLRKGWDALLRAYCQEFAPGEPVGLLLKITRAHGHTLPQVRGQADEVLREFGQALVNRPDIVLWDTPLSAQEMAALYRSASAFVLPSRGEGWGRPYMEAMACGVPTIGTRHLGSEEFLTDEVGFLVDASLVPVPEAAAREIPPYRGHRWYEPDLMGLRQAMRRAFGDEGCRKAVAARAALEMPSKFGLVAGKQAIESALDKAERRFKATTLDIPRAEQTRVVLEGEFFAQHSFSHVNEQIALQFIEDPRLALSLRRVQHQPVYDEHVPHAWQLRPYLNRPLDLGPQVTIRHAFPPNWEPVGEGLWVHIQPWEFGYLPSEWIEPLQRQVTECWVPSQYVKGCAFERSGIAAEKVHVIPWGIDPDVFSPTAEPLLLPTDKTFRFLFVGGLIGRKGFDTLLAAYLDEFGPDDDVCLVVKDLGSGTFYRDENYRPQLIVAKDNPSLPSIVYIEELLTHGQLASLYTACQCLAAPYRAEGFGLPILEAMACGLAPMITSGGAADDFTGPDSAYLVPGREVPTTHDWQLYGPPLELSVSLYDVRRALRIAYEDRQRTHRLGQAAANRVRTAFTWKHTAQAMVQRLLVLVQQRAGVPISPVADQSSTPVASNGRPLLGACLVSQGAERKLSFALAQVVPFVDETVVVVTGTPDRSEAIAKEYGAKVVVFSGDSYMPRVCDAGLAAVTAQWVFWVDPEDQISETDLEQLRNQAAQQPHHVAAVMVDLPESRLASSPLRRDGKLHLIRHPAAGRFAQAIASAEC